jgi:hypothetical protein
MICDELNNLVHVDMQGTFNTSVKNREQLKNLHLAWAFLQAADIIGTFTAEGTGICSCCMVQVCIYK